MQTSHGNPRLSVTPPSTAIPKHVTCSAYLQAPARAGLALSPLLHSPTFLSFSSFYPDSLSLPTEPLHLILSPIYDNLLPCSSWSLRCLIHSECVNK